MFGLFESKGIKRTVSVLLFLLGQAPVPALAPWVPLINTVASLFGVVGVGHAAVDASKK